MYEIKILKIYKTIQECIKNDFSFICSSIYKLNDIRNEK